MTTIYWIDGKPAFGDFPCSPFWWPSWKLLATIRLLLTGSEEREVLGVGSIPVAILPSCQDMKSIAL